MTFRYGHFRALVSRYNYILLLVGIVSLLIASTVSQ